MNTYQTLTFNQTGDLLRALGNGKIGFDHKRYKIAELRTWIANGIASGSFDAAHVETLALAAKMPPPQPVAAPVALPPPPQPVAAPVALPPQPVALPPQPVALPPQPVALPPQPVALPPQPVALPPQPQPFNVMAAPVAPGMARRMRARDAFADQPAAAALMPDDLFIEHYAHADAPLIDPLYRFDPINLHIAMISMALDRPIPTWLGGAAGTGKTAFARQLAARFGRAFFRVGYNRATEPSELLGDMGLRDQNSEWIDGPITQAFRTPGAVLLNDEITYCPQGYLAALNPVFEGTGEPFRLPRTGVQLFPAPGVFVLAADNTMGQGDSTGEYNSRIVLSRDTSERFRVRLQFNYMTPEDEAQLLRQMVQRDCGRTLRVAQARAIVKVADVARTQSAKGELQGAPGLRACSAMAVLMAHGVDAVTAYTCTVTRAAPQESQEELRRIFGAHWPTNDPDVAFIQGA